MLFSIIIPVYNGEKTLPELLSSLTRQSYKAPFEVLLVDDCSTDNSAEIISQYDNFTLLRAPKNQGPAVCRNMGAARAQGEILVFTDSDCRLDEKWLENIQSYFDAGITEAVMGRLLLPSSTYLGDSISALGFPAGGSLGFEKVWRVDENGYTNSLSTCNCALLKSVFLELGGFDETFPYAGGEDTLLAHDLLNKGYRIKYAPEMIVHHAPRADLSGFISWQFRRGVSSYIFASKITKKSGFVKQRLRGIKNIILNSLCDLKLPLVIVLLILSYATQIFGFLHAKYNPNNHHPVDL
ncbi:MAG: glycosyltransferase [Desulfobulbaceae bacterium]|nr:glycosyltransferase [Desulfobulbaceae bacterium]